MELGPKRPSPLWFGGPNSIIVVYRDPLGIVKNISTSGQTTRTVHAPSNWGIRPRMVGT